MTLSIILGAVLLLVEFFLGKSSIVKPSSTIELVLELAKKVIEIVKDVFEKKEEKK